MSWCIYACSVLVFIIFFQFLKTEFRFNQISIFVLPSIFKMFCSMQNSIFAKVWQLLFIYHPTLSFVFTRVRPQAIAHLVLFWTAKCIRNSKYSSKDLCLRTLRSWKQEALNDKVCLYEMLKFWIQLYTSLPKFKQKSAVFLLVVNQTCRIVTVILSMCTNLIANKWRQWLYWAVDHHQLCFWHKIRLKYVKIEIN